MKYSVIWLLFLVLTSGAAADSIELGSSEMKMEAWAADPGSDLMAPENKAPEHAYRASWYVQKSQRGTSSFIPKEYIEYMCGDFDGCKIRLGMYNWDNTGRVASRETLMYYNTVNHAWRASAGDPAGTDYDGATQHIIQAWACYFTDGKYEGWKDLGDGEQGFGLLSWNQYNAACRLTIID